MPDIPASMKAVVLTGHGDLDMLKYKEFSVPDPAVEKARDHQILPGEVPSPLNPPPGCVFHPRCGLAVEQCRMDIPTLREIRPQHWVASQSCYCSAG